MGAPPSFEGRPEMAARATHALLTYLRNLKVSTRFQNASDGELVQSFTSGQDAGAFTALFNRHGPMVFGVCRRMLGNGQDAEDAFQKTFIAFTRKASSLHERDKVASWLFVTARNIAKMARRSKARQRTHEAVVPVRVATDPLTEMTVYEAQSIADEE